MGLPVFSTCPNAEYPKHRTPSIIEILLGNCRGDKGDKRDNPIGVCMKNIHGFDERWLSLLSLYPFYPFIPFIPSLCQKRMMNNTAITTTNPIDNTLCYSIKLE